MNIGMQVSGTEEVRKLLAALGPQAKTARTLWVNWTGLEAQGEMRKLLPTRFTFRGTSSQFSKAIVFKAARQERLNSTSARINAELVVGSDGPGGTKASATKNFGNLLARHEDAHTSTSQATYRTSDGKSIVGGFFLPGSGLRNSSRNVPRSLYPTSIGAQIRRGDGKDVNNAGYYAKSVRKTVQGKMKSTLGESFVVTEKGIFRYRHSVGLQHSRGEPIWWFTKRVRTPPRLKLWETAQRVFETRAVALGLQAIEEAIFRASR